MTIAITITNVSAIVVELTRARIAKRMSYRKLSDLTDVDKHALWKIEHGVTKNPGLNTMLLIAGALGYDLLLA